MEMTMTVLVMMLIVLLMFREMLILIMQDCIGNSQPWGVVFVDHSPMSQRIKDANLKAR